MFSNISWSEYLTFLAVLTFFWYAYISFVYYRHDLFQRFQPDKTNSRHNLNFTTAQDSITTESDLKNYQPKFPDAGFIMQSFRDEVQAFLNGNGTTELCKLEILNSLSLIAQKYPSLIDSEYRDAMRGFIIEQTNESVGIVLTDADLESIL